MGFHHTEALKCSLISANDEGAVSVMTLGVTNDQGETDIPAESRPLLLQVRLLMVPGVVRVAATGRCCASLGGRLVGISRRASALRVNIIYAGQKLFAADLFVVYPPGYPTTESR